MHLPTKKIILRTFLCFVCATVAGADIFAPVLAPPCPSHYNKAGSLLEMEDIVLIGIGDSLTQGTGDNGHYREHNQYQAFLYAAYCRFDRLDQGYKLFSTSSR